MGFFAVMVFLICPGWHPLWALTWEKSTVALEIEAGTAEAKAEFPFRNEGAGPVTITELKSSCGCSKPQVASRVIPSGGKGTVTVVYKPGDRTGPQAAVLTVRTDEGEGLSETLHLQVDILPVLEIQPRLLFWPKGSKPITRTSLLRQVKDVPVKIIDVKPENDTVEVNYQPGDTPGTWRLAITPHSTGVAFTIKVAIHAEAGGRLIAFSAFAVVR